MYPVILDEPESRFFFDCKEEKHPYYFYPLFKNLLLIPIRKQCFLPSIQMKMIEQNKDKYLKLKICRTHRESYDDKEIYFLILIFEIITMDVVHSKSDFFYMIPLQCGDVNGKVISDLKCFPEIVVCDLSDNQCDRLLACGFFCSLFLNGNQNHYDGVEIDDDLLTRLRFCKSIYDRLKIKERMEKIDFEHLVLTKTK